MLAALHGLEYTEADELRVRRQRSLPKSDAINYFQDCVWLDQAPANSLEHKVDVARRTCASALDEFVSTTLAMERDVLLEGDDLLPEFVESWLAAGAMGAAFLIETNPTVIRSRYRERDRTECIRRDEERLDLFIPHYLGWAQWLREQTVARGLALVDAQGGDSTERIARALGLTV